MPQVGVVIPCYNQANTLSEALESIAWQTVKPHCTVVVDDCSPDGDQIALACQTPLLPYLLVHDENKGPSAARNTGIKFLIERGCDVILPLDADDLLEPELIEEGLKILDTVDMAYPDYSYIGKYRGNVRCPPRSPEELAKVILQHNEMVNTTLYKAEVWQAIREKNGTGYDPKLHKPEHYGWEDWLFFMEAHLLGFRAQGIHRMLFRYRTHEKSGVKKANENAPNVWAYFQQKIERLYGVKLEQWH